MQHHHCDLEVSRETLRVAYWRAGSGTPLILLQGGMADAELHWSSVWDALADRYDVVAPDLPGFGSSTAMRRSSWPDLVAWSQAFLERLELRDVILVGNSFGGTLARILAANAPALVSNVIMVNGGIVLTVGRWRRLLLRTPIGAWLWRDVESRGMERVALERMLARPESMDETFYQTCTGAAPIYRVMRQCLAGPQLPIQPECPMSILWGEADRHTPMDRCRALATELDCANVHAIADAGHLPQLENPYGFLAGLNKCALDAGQG